MKAEDKFRSAELAQYGIERVPAAAKALKIIDYGETAAALDKGGSREALDAACERTLARTRQYAKRQETWMKRYKHNVHQAQ